MSDKPLTYLKPPQPSRCYAGCPEGCSCEQPSLASDWTRILNQAIEALQERIEAALREGQEGKVPASHAWLEPTRTVRDACGCGCGRRAGDPPHAK